MSNDVTETLQGLRKRYSQSALDEKDCDQDPARQLEHWLQEAINSQCDEPNAFVLSTCADGKPRSRVVLLKGLSDGELSFYTNYKSAKGDEISHNDSVAMNFLWLPLQRQVRIEGRVVLAPAAESDAYFQKRPRGSQLGAIASPQSSRVSGRTELEDWFAETEKRFHGEKILPRPAHWGGYRVIPEYYEFWQGRDNRLHDRVAYQLTDGRWDRFRLAP